MSAETLAARDAWAEQVWASALRPLERLVALAYADHARDGLVGVWVTTERLRERTGLSRDAAFRALRGLREAGWLVVVEEARQHRATRYALLVPDAQQSGSRTSQRSVSRTADDHEPVHDISQQSASRTAGALSSPSPDTSSPSPDTSSPSRVPDSPSYNPSHHRGAADGRRGEVEHAASSAGVPPDVLGDVVDLALADAATHSPGGRMARDGRWRDGLVATVRQQRARTSSEELRRLRSATQPPCSHGEPGGANRLPSTGQLICPLCRRAEAQQLSAVAS